MRCLSPIYRDGTGEDQAFPVLLKYAANVPGTGEPTMSLESQSV